MVVTSHWLLMDTKNRSISYHFILLQKLPHRIHQPGNFYIRHLGEIQEKTQETICVRRASVTASVRLPTPSLDKILLTCDLIVDRLTINLPAIRLFTQGFFCRLDLVLELHMIFNQHEDSRIQSDRILPGVAMHFTRGGVGINNGVK